MKINNVIVYEFIFLFLMHHASFRCAPCAPGPLCMNFAGCASITMHISWLLPTCIYMPIINMHNHIKALFVKK